MRDAGTAQRRPPVPVFSSVVWRRSEEERCRQRLGEYCRFICRRVVVNLFSEGIKRTASSLSVDVSGGSKLCNDRLA